jgi:hypothetical protein
MAILVGLLIISIIGIFIAAIGAICAGLFGGSNAGMKVFEAAKYLFSVAVVTMGIVAWVKTGDWLAFVGIILMGGFLSYSWDRGFQGTKNP